MFQYFQFVFYYRDLITFLNHNHKLCKPGKYQGHVNCVNHVNNSIMNLK